MRKISHCNALFPRKTACKRLKPQYPSLKSPYSTKKTSSSAISQSYTPDFSITPSTYAYQLPVSDQKTAEISVAASPISLLFEYTGVETSTSNHAKNQQVFDTHPLTSFKALHNSYSRLMRARKMAQAKGQGNIPIERPRNIKLTSRDFIDDSLYNPAYGYFNKDVEIFHLEKPFDFNKIASLDQFLDLWHYELYEHAKSSNTSPTQRWHTPSELFHPYYGRAVAEYLVQSYQKKGLSDQLIIYEIGAGNGTLMIDILDYLQHKYPTLYEKTEYRVIEISSKLSKLQKSSSAAHLPKIKLLNKDIFLWDEQVEESVFVLAFEVFDNFAHDILRYNIETTMPYQGYVVIDKNNDFKEFFNPKLDYWCYRYLSLRENTEYYKKLQNRPFFMKWFNPKTPTDEFYELNQLQNYAWPFRNKLSRSAEFIPTKLVQFFDILHSKFPNHHLVATDFNSFDGQVPFSYNGPVVQTLFSQTKEKDSTVRAKPLKKPESEKEEKKLEYQLSRVQKDKMVNISTYMAHQGYFDIMFATNFELVAQIYEQITGRKMKVDTHKGFLSKYGDVELTKCQNGENPMLEMYRNVDFMANED